MVTIFLVRPFSNPEVPSQIGPVVKVLTELPEFAETETRVFDHNYVLHTLDATYRELSETVRLAAEADKPLDDKTLVELLNLFERQLFSRPAGVLIIDGFVRSCKDLRLWLSRLDLFKYAGDNHKVVIDPFIVFDDGHRYRDEADMLRRNEFFSQCAVMALTASSCDPGDLLQIIKDTILQRCRSLAECA